jgi:hypothetical protein
MASALIANPGRLADIARIKSADPGSTDLPALRALDAAATEDAACISTSLNRNGSEDVPQSVSNRLRVCQRNSGCRCWIGGQRAAPGESHEVRKAEYCSASQAFQTGS